MIDRMVGYPGSGEPIRAWIDKNVAAEAKAVAPAKPKTTAEVKPTA
jgi:hypothetical protein